MRTIRGLLGERKIGYPTNCLPILKPKYIGKTTTTTQNGNKISLDVLIYFYGFANKHKKGEVLFVVP